MADRALLFRNKPGPGHRMSTNDALVFPAKLFMNDTQYLFAVFRCIKPMSKVQQVGTRNRLHFHVNEIVSKILSDIIDDQNHLSIVKTLLIEVMSQL